MLKNISVLLAAAVAVSGCATYTGWTPTYDSYKDPNSARIPLDEQECQMMAKQAGSTGTEALKGGVVGGLVGAAAGAAVGAAVGNPGTGAAIGAASGGIGGATYQGVSGDDQYKRAFINCMRGRGHNVIN
ncbi:MAG: glycine zipper family protein [Methylococcus sp.]|nr:glycine zipper family protein [Methylococcus sp.]